MPSLSFCSISAIIASLLSRFVIYVPPIRLMSNSIQRTRNNALGVSSRRFNGGGDQSLGGRFDCLACRPRDATGSRRHGSGGSGAILANGCSLALLWAYRTGDANMRAVWMCTRNDVVGNVAVLLAALGVSGTGWSDVIVAGIMPSLALSGAVQILRHAAEELRAMPAAAE